MRVDPSRACPDASAIRTHEGRRHCTRCNSDVLDLRHVTERQATAMIAAERARTGHVCISLFTDDEGRASFLVEPETRRRLPVLPMAFAATVASACAAEDTRPSPVSNAPTAVVATTSRADVSDVEAASDDADAPSLDTDTRGAVTGGCAGSESNGAPTAAFATTPEHRPDARRGARTREPRVMRNGGML